MYELNTLTRGGPPKYNDPVCSTITASSHIVGTYAPPAVQGPQTTAIYTNNYYTNSN